MATYLTSNTGSTKSTDRTAGGSKPDNTPATGTTASGGGTGPVTSVSGSVGVGASPTTGNVSVYLNTTGVTANTYGSSTTVPVIAVNAQGQITSASNVTITGSSGVTSVSGTGTVNGITLSGTVTSTGNLTLGGTLSGVTPSQLTNSSVTVTAGTGLSGGGSVSLGGTTTLTNSGVTSVAGAGTVSVSASTGNVTITGSGLSNPMTTLGDTIYENSTPAAARLAGNTGTRRQYLSQTGTGSVSAPPAWVNGPMYNVNDFGIVAAGVGGTDLTSAINTMLSSVPNGGCVYFPSNGNYYRVDGPINVSSKQVHFRGDGSNTTKFITTSTTANILYVTNSNFTMSNLGFKTNGTRVLGNPLISINSSNDASSLCNYEDIFLDGIAGDGMYFYNSCYNLENSTLQSAPGCGVLLHAVQSGTTMNSVNIRNSNNTAPTFILEGQTTSATITNCGFGGGGPRYSYAPSSVAISGSTIVTTMTTTTGFLVDDFIVLSGMTTAAFNGFWRISAVTTTQVTAVATPFYPLPSGTCTVGSGLAQTVPCAVLISNSNGAVNESLMTNCLFGAVGYPPQALSSSLYIQGTYTSTGTVEGWCFSNLYLDYGNAPVLITNAVGEAYRFNFDNIQSLGELTQFFINKSTGVMISNSQGSNAQKVTSFDVWSSGYAYSTAALVSDAGYNFQCISSVTSTTHPASDPTHWLNLGPIPSMSCALYAYSDSSNGSQGLQLTGNYLGGTPVWKGIGYSVATPTYGVVIDGQIGVFVMSATIAWGVTAPTYNLNSGITSSTLVGGAGNLYLQGTSNPPTKTTTPTYFP